MRIYIRRNVKSNFTQYYLLVHAFSTLPTPRTYIRREIMKGLHLYLHTV